MSEKSIKMASIHQRWQRILDPNLDPRLFRNAFLLAKIKAMSKAIEESRVNTMLLDNEVN